MAFIYNLTDSWTDAATTWNGIKLAVTNTASSASSNLLNLTVTGATTASFVVDKSGNLALNGTVNKITFTAPATGATLTLADNSTFITSGAYSSTFTFTGTTTLTFPTSGTVTALGNTTTGTGAIVLASSPTLITPALGTPSSGNLANCTAYPISALSGAGTGVLTALAVNVGAAGSFVTFNGALGTPSSGDLTNCTGITPTNIGGLGTGVATALGVNVGTAGAFVAQNGVLGTPSSGTLTNATGLPISTGVSGLGTSVATALGTNVGSAGAFVVNGGALGTPSSGTLTNATGLPISTGVSGLGTGVATFLATPSSANLASAVTDETGSGPLVFATSPTFTSQINLGTASTTQGSLVLANTSANTLTLKSSNSTAAAYTLTFPSAAPVNGYYLQTDSLGQLSWAAGGGGGGGSPGGSNTQVQFNDAANFGGVASFTFDKTTYTLGLGAASASTGKFSLYNASSVNATSIQAGNASAAVTYTLPTAAPASNGYVLSATTAGVMSWVDNATALAVGTSSITGGTSGRVLYDNAGVLGEYSAVPVANGGTGTSTAFTAGSVVFAGASGTYSQSNANFFWDNTNNYLGLGTATPGGKLDILAGAASLNAMRLLSGNASNRVGFSIGRASVDAYYAISGGASSIIAGDAAGDLDILTTGKAINFSVDTGNTKNLTLDTSGNLGLGVTPSAWSFGGVLQSGRGAFFGDTGGTSYLFNAYYSAGYKYIATGATASRYEQSSGTHQWYIAPSGTANTAITFTQAMTLDASGNLGIGTTSPTTRLQIGDATVSAANKITLGKTTAAAETNLPTIYAGSIISAGSGNDVVLEATSSSGGVVFRTLSATRAVIDSSGNVLVGGTAARGTTVGSAHLDLFNGTAPAGTLTNGISLYSSSGDFNFMDASGNGYKVGFRNIPQVTKSGAYTPTDTSDVGKHISITTGGVTVNASVFSAGDVFTIYNNSGSNQTITQGTSVTMYQAGTANTGNRTLAQRGVCTVLCVASNTFVISGAGVT